MAEYDTAAGNPWVPHPPPFAAAVRLFGEAGFARVRKRGERPPRYRDGNLYAAVAEGGADGLARFFGKSFDRPAQRARF